jgi:hypothetical protein
MLTRQKAAVFSGIASLLLLASCGNDPVSVSRTNADNSSVVGAVAPSARHIDINGPYIYISATGGATGGGPIYRYSNASWIREAGYSGFSDVKNLGVQPNGALWFILQTDNSIYFYSGGSSSRAPGSSVDIDVGGSANSPKVWMIGYDGSIRTWTGSGWSSSMGTAWTIAVEPSGIPWIIDYNKAIKKGNGVSGGWSGPSLGTGYAIDIGTGGVYKAGLDGKIYKYTGNGTTNSWAVKGTITGATDVAVASNGNPWCVTSSGGVYAWNGSSWVRM